MTPAFRYYIYNVISLAYQYEILNSTIKSSGATFINMG